MRRLEESLWRQERLRPWARWPAESRTTSTTPFPRLLLFRSAAQYFAGFAGNAAALLRTSVLWEDIAICRADAESMQRSEAEQLVPVDMNLVIEEVIELTRRLA